MSTNRVGNTKVELIIKCEGELPFYLLQRLRDYNQFDRRHLAAELLLKDPRASIEILGEEGAEDRAASTRSSSPL